MTNKQDRIATLERKWERIRKRAQQDMELATTHHQMVHAMNKRVRADQTLTRLAHH